VYWELGKNDSEIPSKWPPAFNTLYGMTNPMNISFDGSQYFSYLTVINFICNFLNFNKKSFGVAQ